MLWSQSWLQTRVWIVWVFVQNFLSELNPSLEIPPSKLTRWHPRFALDSVPDIEPSELPAPPFKVYQTAVQVLDAARENLPARVRRTISVRRKTLVFRVVPLAAFKAFFPSLFTCLLTTQILMLMNWAVVPSSSAELHSIPFRQPQMAKGVFCQVHGYHGCGPSGTWVSWVCSFRCMGIGQFCKAWAPVSYGQTLQFQTDTPVPHRHSSSTLTDTPVHTDRHSSSTLTDTPVPHGQTLVWEIFSNPSEKADASGSS